MEISFPQIESLDPETFVINFLAILDGKKIMCKVSSELLQDKFGGATDDPINIFKQNRCQIEKMAENLMRTNQFETENSIFINTRNSG